MQTGQSERDPAAATDCRTPTRSRHDRGLLLVGAFKLSKAAFFLAVGAGALHLIHRNLGEVVMHVVNALPIDPEGRMVGLIMDRVDLIGGHQLRQAGIASLGYAALCVVEGTGLMLERTWAEYITVSLSLVALPWELFEIWRRYSPFKLGVLVVNLAVLAYLLYVLRQVRRDRRARLQAERSESAP